MAGGALRWGPVPATAPVFPTIGGGVHGYGGCVLQCVGTLRMAQLAKYKGKQSRWQAPQSLIVAAPRGSCGLDAIDFRISLYWKTPSFTDSGIAAGKLSTA